MKRRNRKIVDNEQARCNIVLVCKKCGYYERCISDEKGDRYYWCTKYNVQTHPNMVICDE